VTDEQPETIGDMWRRVKPTLGAAPQREAPGPTLRDQLADAIRSVCINHPDGVPCVRCATRLDAVLPVVEAAIERAEQQGWTDADEAIIRPERALHEQTIQRAEQAEAAVERVRALVAKAHSNPAAWFSVDKTGAPFIPSVPVDDLQAALTPPEEP